MLRFRKPTFTKPAPVDLRHEITEREQAQQALASLNEHIAAVSHRAGMAEVVNSVLHNVGNVLNSVNVSAATVIGSSLATHS